MSDIKPINVFEILNIEATEIRHSRMLFWLFNADGSHNLGDNFVRAFFNRALDGNCPNVNWNDAIVKRENPVYSDNDETNGYIDLCVICNNEKQIFIIENKVHSKERVVKNGLSQLTIYKNYIDKSFPGYTKHFFLLSPDGIPANDSKNKIVWLPISYKIIEQVLSNDIKNNIDELDDYCRLFLLDYLQAVTKIISEGSRISTKRKYEYNGEIYESYSYNNIGMLCRNIIANTILELQGKKQSQKISEYITQLKKIKSKWLKEVVIKSSEIINLPNDTNYYYAPYNSKYNTKSLQEFAEYFFSNIGNPKNSLTYDPDKADDLAVEINGEKHYIAKFWGSSHIDKIVNLSQGFVESKITVSKIC